MFRAIITTTMAIIPSINITIITVAIAIIMSPWSWRRSPRGFRVYTNLGQVVPRAVPATKQRIGKILFRPKKSHNPGRRTKGKAPASHPGLSCVPTSNTTIDVVSREKLPFHRTCRPWRQPRSWTFVIFNICTFLLEP